MDCQGICINTTSNEYISIAEVHLPVNAFMVLCFGNIEVNKGNMSTHSIHGFVCILRYTSVYIKVVDKSANTTHLPHNLHPHLAGLLSMYCRRIDFPLKGIIFSSRALCKIAECLEPQPVLPSSIDSFFFRHVFNGCF